jgi:hypothetical protein
MSEANKLPDVDSYEPRFESAVELAQVAVVKIFDRQVVVRSAEDEKLCRRLKEWNDQAMERWRQLTQPGVKGAMDAARADSWQIYARAGFPIGPLNWRCSGGVILGWPSLALGAACILAALSEASQSLPLLELVRRTARRKKELGFPGTFTSYGAEGGHTEYRYDNHDHTEYRYDDHDRHSPAGPARPLRRRPQEWSA